MIPELHRPIAIERIGPGGLDVTVEADAAECAALAQRMGLAAVIALSCEFHLERDTAGTLVARGHLLARVAQTCVISLEEFVTAVEDRFAVRCVPEGDESDDADPSALDEVTVIDGTLDLGEAAAEQLALVLDPYPRAPDAVLPESPDDPEVPPFAALAALRRRH
jgi:uncharacterized metal-binding protein YceD (DUF177 family)